MWRHSQSGNLTNSTIWKLPRTFRKARQRQTGPRQNGARLKHARDTCQIAPPICQSGLRLASLGIWQSGEAIWQDYFVPPDSHNQTTASQQPVSGEFQYPSRTLHPGIRARRSIRASSCLLCFLYTGNGVYSGSRAGYLSGQTGNATYPGKRAMQPIRANRQCELSGRTGNTTYPSTYTLSWQR